MRELKKVTVNVANVELYCTEFCSKSKPCNNTGHVCPTKNDIKNGSASNYEDYGWSVENDLCYDMIADRTMNAWGGAYYCGNGKTDYVHFLVGNTVYCYQISLNSYGSLVSKEKKSTYYR